MRRMIHIGMLLVVLLFALQPVLLIHFCHGTLSEISYPVTAASTGCCDTSAGTSSSSSHESDWMPVSCCHDQVVHLSTDHYLQTAGVSLFIPFVLCAAVSLFLFLFPSFAGASEGERLTNPPPLWRVHGLEALRRLCIYRL